MRSLLTRYPLAAVAVAALIMPLTGCSSDDDVLSFEETDPFVRQVYDAVVARDFDSFVALCVQPGDIGVHGKPLMTRRDPSGTEWRAYYKQHFDRLQREIEEAGGVSTLTWDRPGQAAGYMKAESEFVLNLYAEVTVGPNLKKMVLEIGPTFKSETRGRLIDEDSAVYLKSWAYYEANVL